MSRQPIIHTGRKQKSLCRIPPDMDFTAKDGNTEYEVIGYFDSDADECVIEKIIRKLENNYQEQFNLSL